MQIGQMAAEKKDVMDDYMKAMLQLLHAICAF